MTQTTPENEPPSKVKILFDNARLRVLTTTQNWGVPHLIAAASITGLALSVWDRIFQKKP